MNLIGQQVGYYKIERLLGRGGMAEVYKKWFPWLPGRIWQTGSGRPDSYYSD